MCKERVRSSEGVKVPRGRSRTDVRHQGNKETMPCRGLSCRSHVVKEATEKEEDNEVDVCHVGKCDESLQIGSGIPLLSKGYLARKNQNRKLKKTKVKIYLDKKCS